MPAEESQQMVSEFQALMADEFEAAQSYKPNSADWLGGAWEGLKPAEKGPRRGKTGLSTEQFDALAKALPGIPEDFNPNSKVVRLMDAKRKMFDSGEGFDWATAEAMAFGSLLMEGAPIRFSGQDVRRGTFTQRHAVLTDQNTEATHTPLTTLSADQARLEIIDSPLSELGVLGFEYGYSTAEPKALTLWEAQFGDFSNGAQIIIDQFISSAEAKWLRMSGLVMPLPHGYEGQGPEHSSARLERYLQMCGEDNWQVANCTTPANYFHILRRQLRRDFRKPLVLMTPKSLLRHKRCVSSKADFMNGSTFHRVLLEDRSYDKKLQKAAKRVVLCSGKVYYDLLEAREAQGLDDVHLMRIEQLYPFPSIALSEELEAFKHCEFVWCQEEPKNMGAWTHVDPYIEDVLEQINAPAGRAGYAGRTAAASPATGSNSLHKKQQAALVEEALTGPIKRR
ncbi:MAG: 2-oxoglutarate dehydrogenase E1 component [Rhodospirillaceae bacterium]|nr:MAG: 2-oxoglutarate dehydrogenase E1 component [Rhodospirillaceae bacterium]